MQYGKVLREMRQEAGLSVRQLAAKAHIAFSTVHTIEVGKHRPTASTIAALTKALGSDPQKYMERVVIESMKRG